jgi:hypothetical protein
MTVLTPPRHYLVDQALRDARAWCSGHTIDAQPAIAHAARVAVVLGHHEAGVAPALVAAALLHDSPEFAPPTLDLDDYLHRYYGPRLVRVVRGLQADHDDLDAEQPPTTVDDQDVVLLSTVDKVVALGSALRRARRCGDVAGFFAARQPLVRLLPHFRACRAAAQGRVPATLTAALGIVLDDLEHLIASAVQA